MVWDLRKTQQSKVGFRRTLRLSCEAQRLVRLGATMYIAQSVIEQHGMSGLAEESQLGLEVNML